MGNYDEAGEWVDFDGEWCAGTHRVAGRLQPLVDSDGEWCAPWGFHRLALTFRELYLLC